ncbi:MAG TPA: type 4a pilus biogenesis protein PilO [Acidimicrobiales bacterium]|nr:type 4a pilus biogenesis protein PilO [Acidimicrobiales bacterium]
MEQLTRYRVPILTGLGTLVVIAIVFVAWISPEGSKLSSLHAQQTQLESQESHLQTELATLRNAKAHLVSNCAQLTRDLSEIPGAPSVDDFFHDITNLAVASGDLNTPSISVTQASSAAATGGARPVAVTLTLAGTYGQMTAFLHGLDSFPRLFTVSSISVNGGPVATGGQAVNASTGGYNLTLSGNIYYSSGQANVCATTTTAAP